MNIVYKCQIVPENPCLPANFPWFVDKLEWFPWDKILYLDMQKSKLKFS